jgi:hypothetical protein
VCESKILDAKATEQDVSPLCEVVSGGWKGGAPEDPCDDGNNLEIGAGNVPPSDIDMSRNTGWMWGHFVNNVVPAPFSTGGSGALCNPAASFQPCVAVLVESAGVTPLPPP